MNRHEDINIMLSVSVFKMMKILGTGRTLHFPKKRKKKSSQLVAYYNHDDLLYMTISHIFCLTYDGIPNDIL